MARFIMKDFVGQGAGDPNCQELKLATSMIDRIEFGLMPNEWVLRNSTMQVVNRMLYQIGSQQPTPYGPLDRTLGTSSKSENCKTCSKSIKDCTGHFGHITLELPVFHIGYFEEIKRILHCVCKRCSRVLLDPVKEKPLRRAMRNPNVDFVKRKAMHAQVMKKCKSTRKCPFCGEPNGVLKKLKSAFRLINEMAHKNTRDLREEFLNEFGNAVEYNPELKDHLKYAKEDLDPTQVITIFRNIPDSDCCLLALDYQKSRPEEMIITHLSVPPVCIRPSVAQGFAGSMEDDLTIKLADIVEINNHIRDLFAKGHPSADIVANWAVLQQQVAMYINSDLPGFPKLGTNSKEKIRALAQRLKGKQGRFRGNLSGKRVNFSGRTVISPDPNLRVDQVGVPERMAKILTYPEKVTDYNIERLKAAIMNGPDKYPGANYVEFPHGKINVKFGNPEMHVSMLRNGDIVERHLIDGDVVLFNRQPSLHRLSIMCHRAKVLQGRTLRFNECVCGPYNADFDGDEMNIHVPQTEEARAEALDLMSVIQNLCTPGNGQPVIHPTQDFLTCSFLLTSKDVFFDQMQFCTMCSHFCDPQEKIELPPPAIFKPVRLWTGKQVFSMILRSNSEKDEDGHDIYPKLNLELKEKNLYTSGDAMCVRDGYVVIRNSKLLCGNIGKGTLGGAKNAVMFTLIRDHSPYAAASVMNRLAALSSRWIGNRGFSIGIDDVTPSPELWSNRKAKILAGYQSCRAKIKAFEMGQINSQAGCDAEQTLENQMIKELSDIRDALGDECVRQLDPHHCAPLIMTLCGSKGSRQNISQMVTSVGQQIVSGARIPYGFVHRTLPHFAKHSKGAEAKGFVENSFYSGLTATEFFFHTIGGREGLVDTAVKTADTGYMQRRFTKALEDLCVQYDGSVRTAECGIVQLSYGDDGLDPIMMADGHNPVAFDNVWDHVRAANPFWEEPGLGPKALSKIAEELMPGVRETCSAVFAEQLEKVLEARRQELADMEESLAKVFGKQHKVLIRNILDKKYRVTDSQLRLFVETCRTKYLRACIEPGTAVGAVAAQSLGEPTTQMTLKTFHFAGMASMNITQGVPRITEIINATKKISSPIIYAPLVNSWDVKSARVVKGRIEKTHLGDVAEYVEEVLSPSLCFLSIKLDLATIEQLQLSISVKSVAASICAHKFVIGDRKVGLISEVTTKGEDMVRVLPPTSYSDRTTMMFAMQALKNQLPGVMICGIPDVNRAVIERGMKGEKVGVLADKAKVGSTQLSLKGDTTELARGGATLVFSGNRSAVRSSSFDKDSNITTVLLVEELDSDAGVNSPVEREVYKLVIEGYNLLGVMATQGVKDTEVISNFTLAAETTLGIEAARQTIINEIRHTMQDGHGLNVDIRHTSLLADVMSYRGMILGINRQGLAKMKNSPLVLASFEMTSNHLFDAAIRGRTAHIDGVSECIITGAPVQLGTGVFKLMHDMKKATAVMKRPPLLLHHSKHLPGFTA